MVNRVKVKHCEDDPDAWDILVDGTADWCFSTWSEAQTYADKFAHYGIQPPREWRV